MNSNSYNSSPTNERELATSGILEVVEYLFGSHPSFPKDRLKKIREEQLSIEELRELIKIDVT